jgi:hypothetical protein
MGLHGLLQGWLFLSDADSKYVLHEYKQAMNIYVGVLISLWLFLFSYLQHNQKNFLDGLKKLEQRTHKCVELRGDHVE